MTLAARHAALSDIGLHRKTNEDAFVEAPPLFAVCDGMGGAQAGEVASDLTAETLAAAVAAGEGLLAAAEQANAAVYRRAGDDLDHSGMGTTLTAVLLEGDSGHFVHIGDSRAYLLRDGELRQLSDDHSLVGEMLRDGRITASEAAVHPHRSILSRALGTEPDAEFDEFTVDLLAGDALLLCSDGLSGPVSTAAIAKALSRDDPGEAARKLVAEARKHGGPDNITAVVVRFDAPEEERAAEVDAIAGEAVALGAAVSGEAGPAARGAEAAGAVEAGPEDDAGTGPGDAADALAALRAGPAGESADGPAGESADRDAGEDAGSAGDAPAASSAGEPRPRRRGLGCLAVVLVLLVAVGLAGAVTLSTVFYIGVDDGTLTVYSGLPVSVGPLHLHAVYRRSTRAYDSLVPNERELVDAHSLHDKAAAMDIAGQLGMWP